MDRNSIVWAGTNRGLYSLDDKTITYYPAQPLEPDGLQSPVILAIYEDSRSNLWVGTRNGMHLLDRANGKFVTPKLNNTYPEFLVIDIAEDNNDILWASQRLGPNRLFTYDPAAGNFNIESRFIQDGEFRIDFDADNSIWISSRGRGLFRVTEDSERYFDPSQSWKHGFWGVGVFDVLHDKYSNIWVLGEEVLLRPGNFKGFNSIQGSNYVVQSVFADDDYIWYSANDAWRWDRETGETEKFLTGFEMREIRNPVPIRSQSRIYHFEEWGEDLVMASTRNVVLWDRSEDRYTDLPTNVGGPIRDLVIDDDNNAWFAVNQLLPMRMQLPGGEYTRIEELRAAYTSHAVARSADGIQWWGNRLQGLFRYDPASGNLTQFVPDEENPQLSLSSFTVHDILCHSNGSVWVGTNFGLDHIDPSTLQVTQYPLESHNVNTQVTAILEGEGNTIWIGTKDGLLYLDPTTDSLRRFTKDDGLINTVFTERACYRDHNGVLYFGGDEGIDYFHPNDIGTNTVPPDLYVRSVIVNNQSLTTNTAGEHIIELSLSYKQNFIEVEIIGLHFASPEMVTYAYRLPLQSEEWIELGHNRTISLAPLSPGDYILEAKCANGDGVWSEPRQLLSMTITPPFWLTAWFITLISILALSFIYLLYRFRVQQIRRAEKIKSELTQKIAETEMKALRAQMNPHFLFNSLNSIRFLVDKGDNVEAKHYLTMYSQLIRRILDNSRHKFIRLDEELETLSLYVSLEQMRFKNFKFVVDVAEDVETDFIEIPPLLLQPYVENALWHGLMNKQDGKKVLKIEVKKVNSTCQIVVEDNGIGRHQAKMLNARSRVKKESLGLRIAEDRLNYLGDFYGQKASVVIHDLVNPTGTRVVISIPVEE